MCVFFSTKALITLPSAVRDMLILLASLSLSPQAPVLDCRQDPAKSTKFSLPPVTTSFQSDIFQQQTVKMQWDLEETAFIFVDPTVLRASPIFIFQSICAEDSTGCTTRSLTKTPLFGSYLIYLVSTFFPKESRSLISQLQIQMKDTLICDFFSQLLFMSKKCKKERGIMPINSGLSFIQQPNMLKLFPQPVCPQARIVELKPQAVLQMNLKAVFSYISS